MIKLILVTGLFLGSSAIAGQPSSCDDAFEMESQVIAMAKEKLSKKIPAAIIQQSSFSTDSQNIEDDMVHGGEIWTVQVNAPTGHAALKIHVIADDGACLAE